MFSIKQIINYLFDRYIFIDKIAFYINEEYMFDHYYNVMIEMNNEEFDIILANKFKLIDYDKVVNDLKNNGWNIKFLDEIMYKYKYKCLVSHLYFGGNTTHKGTISSRLIALLFNLINIISLKIKIKKILLFKKQYFQNRLADYNIRYVYGADIGSDKMGEYINLFDECFAHGPRDAKILQEKYNKPIFEIGYPRYDKYFEDNIDRDRLLNKYACDINKKTIFWICTVSIYFSTIETYATAMQKLTKQYNVIIRPHPLEIDSQYSRFNQKVFDIVNSGVFILNDNAYQDMTELYKIADYVICDYGGSIFSAMYMNQNIILLNHKDVYKDLGVYTSTSMEVRNYLPSINENEIDKLESYLLNDNFWKEESKMKARKYYFGDSMGESASNVVDHLSKIINN